PYRARKSTRCRDQLQHLAAFVAGRELGDHRNVRQIGVLLETDLYDRYHQLLGDPVRLGYHVAVPRHAAGMDLAPLEGWIERSRAAIAPDDLEFGAGEGLHHRREDIGLALLSAGGADDDFALANVLHRSGRRRVPGHDE